MFVPSFIEISLLTTEKSRHAK